MGATHVTVRITNPAAPDRFWEGLFLVDTGATDSLVPRPHLEAIGLKPEGKRVYELADGSELVLDVAVAKVEFMGRVRWGNRHLRRRWRGAAVGRDGAGIRRHRSGPSESAIEAVARRTAQVIRTDRRALRDLA